MNRLIASIVLFLAGTGFLWSQPAQTIETLTFQAAVGDSIVVRSDYGRVRVSAWEEPFVEIRIRRIGASESELASVAVSAEKQNNRIFVESSFYSYTSQSVYIDIKTPEALSLVIWGTSPAVEVYGLAGYTRVHTLTGLITAADLTASTSLATESGDILYYANTQPRGDVRLETVHGSIRCHIKPELNLRSWMRAGATLDWNNEVEMSRGSLEKQLGIGGPLLYANSAEGGVTFLLSGSIDTGVLAADNPTPTAPTQPVKRRSPVTTDGDTSSPRTDRRGGSPPVLGTPAENSSDGAPLPDTDDVTGRQPPTQSQGGTPIFRVDVDWVFLNASVRDRRTNRAVPNLRQEDFELLEDDVPQQIERFDTTEVPFNLLMLLDVSGSTRGYLDEVKDASIEFTAKIKTSDRIAVATFNSRPRLVRDFTNDRDAVASSIRRLKSGGGTAFYDAMALSLGDYLKGIEGRKAIVVFTDGVDNRLTGEYKAGSHIGFRKLFRLVEETETLVYTIFLNTEDKYGQQRGSRSAVEKILEDIFRGGGRGVKIPMPGGDPAYEEARQQLQLIADQTGGRMYAPTRIRDLNNAYAEIADDLRIQYTLGYSSTNPQRDSSWRDIRLKIKNNRNLAVRTRKGYYAGGG